MQHSTCNMLTCIRISLDRRAPGQNNIRQQSTILEKQAAPRYSASIYVYPKQKQMALGCAPVSPLANDVQVVNVCLVRDQKIWMIPSQKPNISEKGWTIRSVNFMTNLTSRLRIHGHRRDSDTCHSRMCGSPAQRRPPCHGERWACFSTWLPSSTSAASRAR